MAPLGYTFSRNDLAALVVGMQFPERSRAESALITHFLLAHGLDYDRYAVSQRVGQGRPADPNHEAGIQQQTVTDSKLRIDLIAWVGSQPFIFEVKQRANHHALGQLQTYQHLYGLEHPDEPEAALAVIASTIDPDMVGLFDRYNIPVYLYTDDAGGGGAPGGGVPPVDGATA